MTNQGRERLSRLADLLESLPEDGRKKAANGMKFNLRTWMTCGTVACACGHAASDPWFKRRGLKLVLEKYCGERYYEIEYRHSSGFMAAADFFDISFSEAVRLFNAEKYECITRPRDVAARIRELLS